ncbi:hypothetical protein ACFV0T_36170 [Streptomyces sp. NPDC059582]|uniref:hypothetical protein n=1 Tax=Streptomyces sp. NPDC059582 TaxID=3346875 RepID=UPI00368B457C
MRSLSEEDALAEEFEACAAEHLPLEHLDPVDMALHDAGVPAPVAQAGGRPAARAGLLREGDCGL